MGTMCIYVYISWHANGDIDVIDLCREIHSFSSLVHREVKGSGGIRLAAVNVV